MTVEDRHARVKTNESVVHRQAQCSCNFCGESHESTIAPPNRSFDGRDETIGLATDNAVGDALGHMHNMMGDKFKDYQGKYKSLVAGQSVTFDDDNNKSHTIKVVTLG